MQTITSERVPIHIWTDYIEHGALQQARNLANLPFAHSHIAIMPDVHQGYGMPIGGVLAAVDHILPEAVGLDIGCGMIAQKTLFKVGDLSLKGILGKIRKDVPVGFEHNLEKSTLVNPTKYLPICYKEYQSAQHQLGSLGGGNHFIEIQKDKDNFIWIMIHTGSRNIGYKVAKHYSKIAKQTDKDTPPSWDLASFDMDSDEGNLYFEEMSYCVNFADSNRQVILSRVQWAISQSVGKLPKHPSKYFAEIYEAVHNYAVTEIHDDNHVVLHRKGAIRASNGHYGIIPGSQGTASYIVRGLGNSLSFESCSHGAGRVMSRSKARKELDLQKEQERLGDIIHSVRTVKDLDEAPSAYKDIDEVMENQKDLVEILYKLEPLAVIKG